MSDHHTPLPADWNDRAYAAATRKLFESPGELTDAELGLFVLADGAVAAEAAAKARAAGVRLSMDDLALDAKARKTPATVGFVADACMAVASAFRTLRVSKRLLRIEDRLAALESRPASGGVTYAGVHQPGQRYAEGALVTRQGGLWCATVSTDATPGTGAREWVLIVKRGEAV